MSSSSGRLYRIVKFHHAAQIFKRESLYFSRPELWDDPYERTFGDWHNSDVFAQCWCSKGVSDAMWRIYSPDHLGVRVSTSTKKLRQALSSKANSLNFDFKFANVNYVSQHTLNEKTKSIERKLKDNYNLETATEILFFKRKPFEHESEFRVIVFEKSLNGKTSRKGIEISINPHDLIDSILIDPRAPDELTEALIMYFKEKLNFKYRVSRSVLYKTPIYNSNISEP